MTDHGAAPTRTTPRRRALPIAIHLARSLARVVVMLWIVATVTFLAIRALPGNPIDVWIQEMQGTGISAEEARAKASRLLDYDVDQPLWSQYLDFMQNLATGNLGNSVILAPGAPVSAMLAERLPWTLFSVGLAMIVAFVVGLQLGGLAAYRRGTWIDTLITNGSAVMDSIPPVLVGIVLTFTVGVVWGIVPIQDLRGAYAPDVRPGFTLEFMASALAHVIAPGIVYVLSAVGGWALAMRSNALGVLRDEYVTQARARGLSERTMRVSYVQRNAQLPLVTGFAISLGFVVSGSVLVEDIFVYPGVGQLLADALARRDYTVMQGVVIVTTVTVLIATAIADTLYGWLDPRTRIEGAA